MYESLNKQTFRDFEWLVTNDASTDNTAKILEDFKNRSDFCTRIIHNKCNKMVSYNCHNAVEIAHGELMIFIGHDDALVPEALQILNNTWSKITSSQKAGLAGIMSNCQDQNGNLVVDEFPGAPCADYFYEMCIDKNVTGEKLICYRTEVLREFQFSTIDRYVPESVILYNISDKYKTFYINDRLRIYYVNQDGIENLSSFKKIKYPKGMWYSKLEDINRRFSKMKKHPLLVLRTFLIYLRMSYHAKIPFVQSLKELNTFYKKMIAFILSPIGYLFSISDHYRKLI